MIKRSPKYLAYISLALINSGCLSTLLGSKDKRSKDYYLPAPGPGWESIDPAEADTAYRNKVDKAILNVSSVCGEERYSSLEDLSKDILRLIPDHTVVQAGSPLSVNGHPALVTEIRGKVDGGDLSARLAVIRTATCVYDILLAGPGFDGSSRSAFDKLLSGFRDGGKP